MGADLSLKLWGGPSDIQGGYLLFGDGRMGSNLKPMSLRFCLVLGWVWYFGA
jgi:hypothetical protein